jgi:hypothetical protein
LDGNKDMDEGEYTEWLAQVEEIIRKTAWAVKCRIGGDENKKIYIFYIFFIYFIYFLYIYIFYIFLNNVIISAS